MTRDEIIKAMEWHRPTVEAGPQSLLRRIESVVALAEAQERQRLHDKFMHMHEQAKATHNYWHLAANVITQADALNAWAADRLARHGIPMPDDKGPLCF